MKNMILTKQALLLHEHDTLIFLSSKCASSSIRRMALFKLGYEKYRRKRKKGGLKYFMRSREIKHCKLGRWLFVVRNPFDRIGSLWLDKTQGDSVFHGFKPLHIKKNVSFSDFVRIICIDRDRNIH